MGETIYSRLEEEAFQSSEFSGVNDLAGLVGILNDDKYSDRRTFLRAYARYLHYKKILSEEDWGKFQENFARIVEREEVKTKTEILGDIDEVMRRIDETDKKIRASSRRIYEMLK